MTCGTCTSYRAGSCLHPESSREFDELVRETDQQCGLYAGRTPVPVSVNPVRTANPLDMLSEETRSKLRRHADWQR